jgi:hypothetical protein
MPMARTQDSQKQLPAVPVLVMVRDEHNRSALNGLLTDAGYVVTLARYLGEVETVIDTAPERSRPEFAVLCAL